MIFPDINPGPQRLAYDLDLHLFGPEPEDRITEIHFGGAKGGGKSYLIALRAMREAIYSPHARIVVMRPTYAELMNIIKVTNQFYPTFGATYCGLAAENPGWTFPSGGRILFGYLDKPQGARWQGQNLTHVFIDEAGEITWERVANTKKELRSTEGLPTALWLSSNPQGPGDRWIYERYMVDSEPITLADCDGNQVNCLRKRAKDGWHLHIPSRLTDNPHLCDGDPTYLARLESSYEHDPERLEALINGTYGIVTAGTIWPACVMVDKRPTQADRLVWAWDTAYQVKATSSYSAGVLMALVNGYLYVLEVVRVKMEFDALQQAIMAAHERHPTAEILIESQASGASLAQTIRNVHNVPVVDVPAATIGRESKYDRQRRAAVVLYKSPLHVLANQHWTHEYVSELARQPNGPADQADATVLGIWALVLNEKTAVTKSTKSWDILW